MLLSEHQLTWRFQLSGIHRSHSSSASSTSPHRIGTMTTAVASSSLEFLSGIPAAASAEKCHSKSLRIPSGSISPTMHNRLLVDPQLHGQRHGDTCSAKLVHKTGRRQKLFEKETVRRKNLNINSIYQTNKKVPARSSLHAGISVYNMSRNTIQYFIR